MAENTENLEYSERIYKYIRRTLVCLQDESILSTGRKRQGVKQPGVWRGACVVCPSSRKEQNENTTALKSVAPTGLGEREILFTLCGASLPGDTESQRRVQRENSAFAKRKSDREGGEDPSRCEWLPDSPGGAPPPLLLLSAIGNTNSAQRGRLLGSLSLSLSTAT